MIDKLSCIPLLRKEFFENSPLSHHRKVTSRKLSGSGQATRPHPIPLIELDLP